MWSSCLGMMIMVVITGMTKKWGKMKMMKRWWTESVKGECPDCWFVDSESILKAEGTRRDVEKPPQVYLIYHPPWPSQPGPCDDCDDCYDWDEDDEVEDDYDDVVGVQSLEAIISREWQGQFVNPQTSKSRTHRYVQGVFFFLTGTPLKVETS